ncbi:TetR family transcriptional regulator [Gordonia sp. (in: high G+C Gram-positive bacteria)]|uniref:TetR/AcrR family transcriptional regulator n=1 Tax=Gordonia sp. (in: high G+C Gram-positive bacteria) TaxID=84139 RepID=UPI0039E47B22
MADKTGRRVGESNTREQIIAAARELFAQRGFGATPLRAIAALAGVDVALIPYYFGNKRGLFVAAMEIPVDPGDVIRRAAAGPRAELGTRIARSFLTTWDDPATGTAMQGVLRSATTDETAGRGFGEFLSDEMLPLAARELGVPIDTVRAAGSMLFGLATLRYLVGAPAFTSPTVDELVATFGPRLQAVIDAG